MEIKRWKIATLRQENGVFGMPLNCVKITNLIIKSDEDILKESAIFNLVAETFPDETFEVWYPCEDRVVLFMSKSGMFVFKYHEWRVEGSYLIKEIVRESSIVL